ncbi:MAG TPA: hypothetical protein VET85_06280 [Stellaceae bacterium]|nr:hypothetical protein [Stellaceae bacterium]
MKYLLGGAAIAALIAAGLPAAAQSNNSAAGSQPTSPSTMKSGGTMAKHPAKQVAEQPGHAKMRKHNEKSVEDTNADELNRQELQRMTQGSDQAPARSPSGTSGSR